MSADRRVQNTVRDQLVAAAVAAERPRRRRRSTLVVAVAAGLLGATAVAEATGLLAVGKPIETLMPPAETKINHKYRAPHGMSVVVSAPDPDYRHPWGVAIYTAPKGEDCMIAGQVFGTMLGRDRGGRFHPYGPGVIGSCGDLGRLPLMTDMMRVEGEHPRTLLFGRAGKRKGPIVFEYRGERRTATPGRGGAFLIVFDGVIVPAQVKLLD